MAIPDLLELLDLPADNARRRYLLQILQRQIAALAACQDESGLWHTLLDDPDSYLERSATTRFAYGILKAIRKRYSAKSLPPWRRKRLRGWLIVWSRIII